MSDPTPPDRLRRLTPTASLAALAALLLAACGGAAGASPADGTTTTPEPASTTAASAPANDPAATDAEGVEGAAAGEATLAAVTPTEVIQAALGETPTPECDTSVLTGAGTCVWKATDGSWLKLEDGESRETPDLASFTDRMTGTLGLDQAVDGLGEAAYVGSSSRGTRIAVFLGEGRVFWVVLNKAGDPAAQTTQVTDIATKVLTAL